MAIVRIVCTLGYQIIFLVNEWDNNQAGSKLFNSAVKGQWEGGSWSTKNGTFSPRSPLLVSANAIPDDLKFEPGVRGKVTCVLHIII